jgi:formylglycine-generating enzyme required for sulfatase activity
MDKVSKLALCGTLFAAGLACANNLQVTNVMVSQRDETTAYVTFDIAWQNAWRFTNINHDAAWVFFKVRQEATTDWRHMILKGSGINPPGYSNGVGTAVDLIVPDDRVGLFVRRVEEGAGTLAVTNVMAVWDLAALGLTQASRVHVRAQAVEMVFVAEGAFAAGSGGSEKNAFTLTTICTNDVSVAPSGSGALGGAAGGYPTGQTAPNLSWPNGYGAFYCMKYEVSEGQWVDFFNLLTDAQKVNHDITGKHGYGGKNSDGVVSRNTVAWTSGDATTLARDQACSYLAWWDGVAIADWSGLRPMTELEFEKACRGTLPPVANEYVWGTTSISATTSIVNDWTGAATAVGGNCNYKPCAPHGPFRVGIYATATSSREEAGASYWGILDFGGSLWERPVTIGHATGRAFTGEHGDGELTSSGQANVAGWPGGDSVGAGFRAGAYLYDAHWTRTSDRENAAAVYAPRCPDYGFRAVRTAPAGVTP